MDRYRSLATAARQAGTHIFYETTVGAALPIIKTLREMIDTGDQIHSVQGILSGTLAYLFNVFDGSQPFSEIVREAKASGFTEPDPRDDLSGTDVARKLTILAREMGQEIELGDFERVLALPAVVDVDRVVSAYNNGILVVTLPKKEKLGKVNITINPGE